MRCRPGDIAITTHPTLTTMVSVLYAAPADGFILPDGHKALRTTGGPCWVCEAMGALFPVWQYTRGVRTPVLRRYAVIPDCWLRPIRGDEPGDEVQTETEQPCAVEA